MTEDRKPHGYWTKERCHEEALKYKRRVDLCNNSNGAYDAARKKGWLYDICDHMVIAAKPVGHWYRSKDNCAKEALKYSHRVDFQKNSIGAYDAAWRNGWLDDICRYMGPTRGYMHRFVYEIADHVEKKIYIGLTCNPERRWQHHKDTARITGKFKSNVKLELITDLLPVDQAQQEEIKLIKYYMSQGYQVLNKAKGGALGGKREYWTKKKCTKVAKQYDTYKDFRTNDKLCYDAASSKGFIDEICAHMSDKRKGYWAIKENVINEAGKYQSRIDFSTKSGAAWKSAQRNGWVDELCERMRWEYTPSVINKWSKQVCIDAAMKCNTRTEFNNRFRQAYDAAWRNGWLDEICRHMKYASTPQGYWTLERCRKEAAKYSMMSRFIEKSSGCYNAAKREGWLDGICMHMPRRSRSRNKCLFAPITQRAS